MLLGKEKLAITLLLRPAVLWQNACGPTGLPPSPQNRIVGKWRSADGSYVVEFLPTGKCSARYRMQGRELGRPCIPPTKTRTQYATTRRTLCRKPGNANHEP